MGKAARKMKKKQVQAETAQSRQANARWETLLAEQMKAGKYAEAIETLAELVKGDDIKPEFMYDAAYAYFMVGDYERAGQWINHTLSYEPGHIPVRILLARLLILQERQDDGLAVFDFVLDKGADTLTEAQRDEIEEIVEFYGRSEGEKIRRSYPHIAALLKLEAPPAGTKDVNQILASLRQKVAAAGAAAGEAVEEAAAAVKPMAEAGVAAAGEAVAAAKPVLEAKAAAAAKKPADILASLKQRLAAVSQEKAKAEGASGTAKASGGSGGASQGVQPTTEGTVLSSARPQPAAAAANVSAAEKTKQDVLKKALPAVQKAEILTSFAGGYYYQGDLASAELLLQTALELDASDGVLRNMALVQQDAGRREEALQTAARMKLADFTLLRLLRQG